MGEKGNFAEGVESSSSLPKLPRGSFPQYAGAQAVDAPHLSTEQDLAKPDAGFSKPAAEDFAKPADEGWGKTPSAYSDAAGQAPPGNLAKAPGALPPLPPMHAAPAPPPPPPPGLPPVGGAWFGGRRRDDGPPVPPPAEPPRSGPRH